MGENPVHDSYPLKTGECAPVTKAVKSDPKMQKVGEWLRAHRTLSGACPSQQKHAKLLRASSKAMLLQRCGISQPQT